MHKIIIYLPQIFLIPERLLENDIGSLASTSSATIESQSCTSSLNPETPKIRKPTPSSNPCKFPVYRQRSHGGFRRPPEVPPRRNKAKSVVEIPANTSKNQRMVGTKRVHDGQIDLNGDNHFAGGGVGGGRLLEKVLNM